MSVLKSEGVRHTCLIKHHEPEETKEQFKEFDLDIIYTTPMIIASDKQVISVLGDQKDLKKFIELIKPNAERITNISFKNAVYQKKDLLSVLTENRGKRSSQPMIMVITIIRSGSPVKNCQRRSISAKGR